MNVNLKKGKSELLVGVKSSPEEKDRAEKVVAVATDQGGKGVLVEN